VKAALSLLGHIAPEIRLPLVWPGEKTLDGLRAVLAAQGLAVAR
jgi:hypothetical protein